MFCNGRRGLLAHGRFCDSLSRWRGGANAASFDCKKASSARERIVCGDAALSELDVRLGKLFDERKAVLSAKGAELLRQSERGWLHYVSTVCPLAAAQSSTGNDFVDCLKKRYEERLLQLAQAGVRLGPYVFARVDLFGAEPAAADEESGYVAGFYVQHAAYPRIDSPLSPQAEAWNRRAAKTLSTGDDCGQGGLFEAALRNTNRR